MENTYHALLTQIETLIAEGRKKTASAINHTNLKYMRAFFLEYPILGTLSPK